MCVYVHCVCVYTHSIPDILCSSLPTGHGMSTGATGVIPSPHHQSSTATAPFTPQQLLSAGLCVQVLHSNIEEH